jgi:hypothetical protein
MPGPGFPVQTLFQSELAVLTKAFNFSNFGQILAGGVLSNPVIDISGPDSALTVAGIQVNTLDFYDANGGPILQPGTAVIAQFSGGTPGATYKLFCRVQCTPVDAISGGDTLEVDGQLTILASS